MENDAIGQRHNHYCLISMILVRYMLSSTMANKFSLLCRRSLLVCSTATSRIRLRFVLTETREFVISFCSLAFDSSFLCSSHLFGFSGSLASTAVAARHTTALCPSAHSQMPKLEKSRYTLTHKHAERTRNMCQSILYREQTEK